jgi:3-methyladenine DNA glycosylase AlkD
VPLQRRIAARCLALPLEAVMRLLQSPLHEARHTALLILAAQFGRAKLQQEQKRLVDAYLEHLDWVNNWDLVDLSAPKILGTWLLRRPQPERQVLYELARSGHLWRQRIAMLATLPLIRQEEFADAFALADLLLDHGHDLIHKAVGWMLREIGKRQLHAELAFLRPRYPRMPRTMLRYAIEKLQPDLRRDFLAGRVK